MFIKYSELLKNLFGNITKGRVSFTQYLETMGYTLGLIGIIAFIVGVTAGAVYLPCFVWRKTIRRLINQRVEIFANPEKAIETATITSKINKRTALYVIGVMLVYVPLMIPTITYLVSLVFAL